MQQKPFLGVILNIWNITQVKFYLHKMAHCKLLKNMPNFTRVFAINDTGLHPIENIITSLESAV